jgi:alkylated DNA repair dioxygenase AlkB
MQLPFFDEPSGHVIPLQDGELLYYPHFFTAEVADRYLRLLTAQVDWKQEGMMMYGKPVLFPRLMAWYGDVGSSYAFSGKRYEPAAWTSELSEIKGLVAKAAGVSFNSVLLNRYRNGNDSMGWHADDEPELGRDPVIASVNFGATRRFMFRHQQEGLKYELNLTHGSLLIMKGSLQHHWQHQVPKTAKPMAERINLTFRVIKPVV